MNLNGLSEKEVIASREKYGSNKLPEPKLKKWWNFVLEALEDSSLQVLIFIAVMQFAMCALGVMDLSEPLPIIAVLSIATAIGVKTNMGIQKSMTELRRKTETRFCDVIRSGRVQTINKNDLVVGDVVFLRSGQEIFADGYIVEGEVTVSNAAINGESKDCKKTPILKEGYIYQKTKSTSAYNDQNSLFAGAIVTGKEGKMIVTDVGLNTVNGDTLMKMQTLEAPKTALNIAVDNLCSFISKYGTIAAVFSFIILMASSILKTGVSEYFSGDVLSIIQKVSFNLSNALTIIVAAVPEGLPMIVQLVTKQNVKVMEKFNILTKNPGKISELAYVDLICTDKTGTLTTGVMTPKEIINGNGKELLEDYDLWRLVKENISLNTSATFDGEGKITGGNSIYRALLTLVNKDEFKYFQTDCPSVKKLPFSSENKYSAYTYGSGNSFFTHYKGAPERIIEKCSYYLVNGETLQLTGEVRSNLDRTIKLMTMKSMRCIALACDHQGLSENGLPEGMILLGIIGVVDPVREEVPEAVAKAHEAGIQVIEITGDCLETAVSVAEDAGIYQAGDVALTNEQFEAMSDDEVKGIIPSLRVISRCSPNTKLRLVTLAQEMGRSVAMTGDGVNDSPALKRSDVGFGMQSGTDVAKEASDIILTDDNFASIVKGVELGRTFMHNIMMFLEFQLPINVTLLILSMIYPLFTATTILASVQILIINIIMDSLNSLSFGGEPPKDEYMKEKPIPKGSGLFINGAKGRIAIISAVFIAAYGVLLLTPVKEYFSTETELVTARFALLCFMAVLNGFNIRTESLNLFKGIGKNKSFIWIALGIFAGVIVACTFLGGAIKATALSVNKWGIIFGLALIVTVADLCRKVVRRK